MSARRLGQERGEENGARGGIGGFLDMPGHLDAHGICRPWFVAKCFNYYAGENWGQYLRSPKPISTVTFINAVFHWLIDQGVSTTKMSEIFIKS